MKCSTISGHISKVTRNVRTFHASVLLVEDPETSYIFFLTIQFECFATWVAVARVRAESCHRVLPRTWGRHRCGDRRTNITEEPLPPTDRILVPTYGNTTVSIKQCDHHEPLQNTRLLKQGEDDRCLGGHTSSCVQFFVARLLASSQNCENRPSATSCLCPSVLPNGTTRPPLDYVHESWYTSIFFENLSWKFKCDWNMTRMTSALHEGTGKTFPTISRWTLLRPGILRSADW